MDNVSVEDILAEPERKEQERALEEKKCWFCEHGICIPSFPFECSKMLPDQTGKKRWIHYNGICPEKMTCEYFKIDDASPGVDERDIWLNAKNIMVG